MPIQAACACGKVFIAQDSLAGKRVKCPQCGVPIDIPTANTSNDSLGLGDLAALESAGRPLQINRPKPAPQRSQEAPVTAEQRRPTKPAQRSAMSAKAGREFQRSLGMLIGGPLLFLVGVAFTVVSYHWPDSRGRSRITYGLILGGLIVFGYGCISLIRARNYRTGRVSESGEAGIDHFTRNLGFLPVLIVAVILAVLGVLATLLFG